MPTREEKIAFIKQRMQENPQPLSRQDKINLIKQRLADTGDASEKSVLSDVGDYALEKVGEAGRFIDKYTGAPTRAAIGAAQDANNPLEAFANQFGEDPELAPTGKEIVQKAGVPDTRLSEILPSFYTDSDKDAEDWLKFKRGGAADISASGAAGLAMDVVADPINVIPGVAFGKGMKVGSNAAKRGTKALGRAAKKSGELISNASAKATSKVGHALTGVPEKDIATYISKTDDVDSLIGRYGDDMSLAADELRENLQGAISKKITTLNDDIVKAIDNAPVGSKVSNDAIVDALEHVKSGVNANYHPNAIKEIDDLIIRVKSDTVDGMINARAANDAKRFLQDMAKGSYLKNGQLFSSSKQASKAAKAGASKARKAEMQLAPGTIEANKELARLHRYEKNVNKNLIAPGKTESALLSAGSGANARNAKNLKEISEAVDFDAIGEAEKLSAARSFGNPSLVPVDATGKSATRMGVGALVGSLAGGPLGTAIGMAFTSPVVLKQSIRAGKVPARVIRRLTNSTGKITDDVLEQAIRASKTEAGQEIIRAGLNVSKSKAVQDYSKVADKRDKRKGQFKSEAVAQKPLKGRSKWAQQGYEKVLGKIKDKDLKNKISKNKESILKNKRNIPLLVEASRLGSEKHIQNIIKRLKY